MPIRDQKLALFRGLLSLAGVRLGKDPATERRTQKTIPTLSKLLDSYMADEVKPKRTPGTAALYSIYFNHAKEMLGTYKITQITHRHISRLHKEIGKTRPVTANRVVAVLSGAFKYANKQGIMVAISPTKGIEGFREEGKERYLTGDELQRLGAALREAETSGLPWESESKHAPNPNNRTEVYSPYVTAAIRLLLFTGCRLREILHLRWVDIDFERGLLLLPTSKTGRKTIILNAPALAVLNGLARGGTYVIAGASYERPRSDLKRPWKRITQDAILGRARLHDLRHSFASVGAAAGMGLPIVGKLLGHAKVETTQRYAHLDADPLRRAAETIGAQFPPRWSGIRLPT